MRVLVIHFLIEYVTCRNKRTLCFNELDNLISAKEISQAISGFKCCKAPCLDYISNYMIKQWQNVLIPCLVKIFNACLSYGLYPKSWAQGYITPLHKSGDSNDTNNYCGITINSAIGKLFDRILIQYFLEFKPGCTKFYTYFWSLN
jgi:hypothetical protein